MRDGNWRECTRCKTVKPVDQFRVISSDDPEPKLHSWCNECKAAQQRERRAAAKDKKRCTMCSEAKPLSEFSPVDKAVNSSGRAAWCKTCMAAHFRARRAREKLPDGPVKAERKKPKICRLCYGLAHRVSGDRCKQCGLEADHA